MKSTYTLLLKIIVNLFSNFIIFNIIFYLFIKFI